MCNTCCSMDVIPFHWITGVTCGKSKQVASVESSTLFWVDCGRKIVSQLLSLGTEPKKIENNNYFRVQVQDD